METVAKDIEKLIVRRLDGELSEDEQLELDRELIRNPAAQRLMEEYKRIDDLAAAALDHALGDDRVSLDPADLPVRQAGRKPAGAFRRRRQVSNLTYAFRWLVPGAAAAALLAILVARFPLTPPSDSSLAERDRMAANGVTHAPQVASPQPGIMREVGTAGPRTGIRRDTGREIIGVVGEDGNIYWIEVERVRTIKRPRPRAAPDEI